MSRALALLDYIGMQDHPVRASEVAGALELNRSTAHHLLATLVDSGYLHRSERRYQVSAEKLTMLGARIHRALQPSVQALELMHRLAAETGETAFIACWDGLDVVIRAVAEGKHAVRVATLSVGAAGDAHARASGKVLLAHRSQEQIDLFLSRRLRRLTPNTITDPDQLRAELESIRAQGFALDQQEYIPGVWCISAPLWESSAPPSTALSISMPADRFAEMRDPYLESMLGLISQVLR